MTGSRAISSARGSSRFATAFRIARLAIPYASFALLKRLVPVSVLARWAWTSAGEGRTRDILLEQRTVAAVVRLRRLFGSGRGDCLEAGLVLYRELSRAGADPWLVMGFAREDARVTGHAWVEVDGLVVGESRLDGRFLPAARFGPRGIRATSRGR